MGKKSSAPPAPDYSGVIAASQKSADQSFALGQQQLEWAKKQDTMNRAQSDPVIAQAQQEAKTNDTNAAADRARYQSIFQPQEDKLVKDADTYSSTTKQQEQAGQAEAGVTQQFDSQRTQAQHNLESFGIDPSSTRAMALDAGIGVSQAAATAAAGNKAIDDTVNKGMALRSEAINVGRGYPGQIAQSYNTASGAGNQAVGAGLQTTASGASTMGTATQYMGLGNQAVSGWGSALNQGYQNKLGQFNADQNASSGWGSALGLVGGLATKAMPAGWLADGGMAEAPQAPNPQQSAIPAGPSPSPSPSPSPNVVPHAASPTNGRAVDDVSARLSAGEFVLPKDVVAWEGEKSLQNMILKARDAASKAGAQAKQGMAIPQAAAYISQGAST